MSARPSSSELEELKELYSRRDSLSSDEGREWVERVSELLHRFAPSRAREFDQLSPYLFAGLSNQIVAPTWVRIGNTIRAAIADLESNVPSKSEPETVPDPRNVFVVHGRNERLRAGLFSFLQSIGLEPIEWSEAVRSTGKASPYIGDVLESAFQRAQAVVVLLTPDDEVRLSDSLWKEDESLHEKMVQMQARPNVLFEAGMAFGTHADRTLLIQVGKVKAFSDVAGRHIVFLDDSRGQREEVARRLETAGCPVALDGDEWLKAGSFEINLPVAPSFLASPPARTSSSAHEGADLRIQMGYLGQWRHEQIILQNHGDAVAHDIAIYADGNPIEEHQVWVAGQHLPTELRPGEELGVKIALGMGSPERADIRVEWREEDGTEHWKERAVQLI